MAIKRWMVDRFNCTWRSSLMADGPMDHCLPSFTAVRKIEELPSTVCHQWMFKLVPGATPTMYFWLNVQLEPQRCSRLERFSIRWKIIFIQKNVISCFVIFYNAGFVTRDHRIGSRLATIRCSRSPRHRWTTYQTQGKLGGRLLLTLEELCRKSKITLPFIFPAKCLQSIFPPFLMGEAQP
jgi:hypothetical protein